MGIIREVVESCAGLNRKQLAQAICELLGWKPPSGALKARRTGAVARPPFGFAREVQIACDEGRTWGTGLHARARTTLGVG